LYFMPAPEDGGLDADPALPGKGSGLLPPRRR
jgi:hypothetical protein